MLSYNELKKGMVIMLSGEPYEVLESSFSRMQQRKAVVQSKLKNLLSGKVVDRSWQASSEIEEADLEKKGLVFLYSHRDEFWFTEPDNPKIRFSLPHEKLAGISFYLKPQTPVAAYFLKGEPIRIEIPIKMDFRVIEAPPSIRGNTAQGGSKTAVIEGGTKISVPFFIEQGDTVRINTETGEYVERVEKAG